MRKELARLYEVVRVEKEKAENAGKVVKFNRDRRVVLIDGVIIDQFNCKFF